MTSDLESHVQGVRDTVQELRELGLGGTVFRLGWELRQRSGLLALLDTMHGVTPPRVDQAAADALPARLPFPEPEAVAEAIADRVPAARVETLHQVADDARRGTILCFGRWKASLGDPPDWYRDHWTGARWDDESHWTRALRRAPPGADVKLVWEAARFPHAYHLARSAMLAPAKAPLFSVALADQIRSFRSASPPQRGIHWASSQEVVFRQMAWCFAASVLFRQGERAAQARREIAEELALCAAHVERHLEYARRAVYNNHLLSEALGLLLAGTLLRDQGAADRWRRAGRETLEEQAERQFYPDGAYIQQSHNYHRVALQDLLWAWALLLRAGETTPDPWRGALERSLDFLLAQQSPTDGRLPNYGANDGALPSILSTCDFSDFRPTLQAVSLAVRGERVYDAGPWDEEAVWLLGPGCLDAPLRPTTRRSVAFTPTGYHVLEGGERGDFGVLRCGSIRDRFSQIDMLHLDVWWRGMNVLVDPGTYLYNGPAEWHAHFMGTSSHNTVVVDGRDQMLHHRRFKCLYWTEAELLELHDAGDHVLCVGEHRGYARHPGGCVHRRAVLLSKPEALWIVVDRVSGTGEHEVRLHWLGGEYPWTARPERAELVLETPAGPFTVGVLGGDGSCLTGSVTAGQEELPRGWSSRYYGEKVPVPSLKVIARGATPLTLVTIAGPGTFEVERVGTRWRVGTASFEIEDGTPRRIELSSGEPA